MRRNAQALQNVGKLLSTPGTLLGRIAHPMGHMVYVCGSVQPFFKAFVRPLVQPSQKFRIICRVSCVHTFP